MRNRREIDERRLEELGPPDGWSERRKSAERRLPGVEELFIPEREFFEILLASTKVRRADSSPE